jgi:hypothetical protein
VFLMLLACSGDPEAVWLFSIEEEVSDADCETTVSHNFVAAGLPFEEQDEEVWDLAESSSLSAHVLYGLVHQTASGWTLLLDGEIYEASPSESETLSFVAEYRTESSESEEHPSGYVFESGAEQELSLGVDLLVDGPLASGTWSSEEQARLEVAESDGFSAEEVGFATGQIPSDDYLVEDDGADGLQPALNEADVPDCSDDPCELQVESSCSLSFTLSAERTDLSAEDFEAVAPFERDAGY